MADNLIQSLDRRIAELEQQLAALKSARTALNGGSTAAVGGVGTGKRKFTAAQRAEISRRMKALWAKRRAK